MTDATPTHTPPFDATLTANARRLAHLLEPLIGQVYFSPECHQNYVALGFAPSPGQAGRTQLPDGPAYFTSRGSVMGQVRGEVVAASFAVFNPAVVVPCVQLGWSRTDATTIATARTDGAVDQLRRVLGDAPAGLDRASALFRAAASDLPLAGRLLYAGVAALGWPGTPWGDFFRAGDRLREYRGDCHTAVWVAAGVDATEIGLLSELYLRLPLRSYARTRVWSDAEFDAATERLHTRGIINDARDGFTDAGHQLREGIERATDRGMAPALAALDGALDELFAILEPWGAAMRASGGYLSTGPDDLARLSRPISAGE